MSLIKMEDKLKYCFFFMEQEKLILLWYIQVKKDLIWTTQERECGVKPIILHSTVHIHTLTHISSRQEKGKCSWLKWSLEKKSFYHQLIIY